MRKEILRMDNVITQNDSGANLNNFNLYILESELMGLLGIDDYGKEILINLILENTTIKYGKIYLENKLVNSYKYTTGNHNKVYVLRQNSQLVNDLSVMDNVFVLKRGFKKYVVNQKVIEPHLCELIKELGLTIDPRDICLYLTEYERCVVEILKAMIQGVKLIIIDDISNVLSADEFEKFKSLMKELINKGYSIMYIGNHHQELFSICHRLAIMQEGKIIKVFRKNEMKDENILPYAISFIEKTIYSKENTPRNRISFKNITTTYLKNISFDIYKGECVVLYDVNNKIVQEMIDYVYGNNIFKDGYIKIDGHDIALRNKKFSQTQLAIINREPIKNVLLHNMSYIDNLCFLVDYKLGKDIAYNKVKKSIQQEFYSVLGEDLFKDDLYELDKKSLYNLIYYRVYILNPKIVCILQPFSNADMYLRRHIVELIRQLKRRGITIIVFAISISDSIYVADKFIVIEKGEKKQEQQVQSLLNHFK